MVPPPGGGYVRIVYSHRGNYIIARVYNVSVCVNHKLADRVVSRTAPQPPTTVALISFHHHGLMGLLGGAGYGRRTGVNNMIRPVTCLCCATFRSYVSANGLHIEYMPLSSRTGISLLSRDNDSAAVPDAYGVGQQRISIPYLK